MPAWGAFVGVCSFLALAVVSLSRASAGVVREPDGVDAPVPDVSAAALFANVGLTHGTILVFVAGAAVLAGIPADALGATASLDGLAAGVVAGVLLAPWLVLLVAHAVGLPIVDQGDTSWIPPSSLFYLARSLHEYLFYSVREYLVYGHAWLVWLAILLAIGAVLRFDPEADPDDDADEVELEASDRSLVLAVWLVVPMVTPYVVGYLFEPIYRHKYTIGASLAFFVMVGYGLTKLWDNYGRVVPAALAILLVVGTVAPIGSIYDEPNHPDWRSTVEELESESTGEPLIVTSPTFMNGLSEYYGGDDVTVRSVPPNATWNGTLADIVAGHDRVWFAYSTWYISDGRIRHLYEEFAAGGYEIDFEREFDREEDGGDSDRIAASYSVFAAQLYDTSGGGIDRGSVGNATG